MQLIKDTFLNLTPPATKIKRTAITGYSGLYCEQNQTGFTFQMKYKANGKYRFMKLERYKYGDNINKKMLDNVIKQFTVNQGIVAQGNDPLSQKQAERETNKAKKCKTVTQVFDAFTGTHHFKQLAESTTGHYLSTYRLYLFKQWGKRDVMTIKRSEFKSYLDGIGSDSIFNSTLLAMKRVQNQAIDMDLIEAPFLHNIETRPVGIRTETLNDDEIINLMNSTDGWDGLRNLAKLQLLTGCRNGEIAGLLWSDIDMKNKTITIPPERIKTEKNYKKMVRPHIIPLMPKMAEILLQQRQHGTTGYMFTKCYANAADTAYHPSSVGRWLKRYIKEDGMSHQLRRTVATKLADISGISEYDVKIILNHAVSGQTAKYIHTQQLDRKREVYGKWHHYIDSLMEVEKQEAV